MLATYGVLQPRPMGLLTELLPALGAGQLSLKHRCGPAPAGIPSPAPAAVLGSAPCRHCCQQLDLPAHFITSAGLPQDSLPDSAAKRQYATIEAAR